MKNGFCIFINTLIDGPVPVEFDEKDCPVLYDSQKDAELQIVEYIEDRLTEYRQGEREFEDATTVEEYVTRVILHPDGSLVDEYGLTFRSTKSGNSP